MPTINGATGFVTTQDYTYDDLNRLASVAEKQYGQTIPDWQQQFTYDRYGNRSMGTGTGQTFGRNTSETMALIGPDPTVSTANNRITPRSGEQYQFDASGNMTRDALGNRSVFDVENHQVEYYYPNNNTQVPDAKYFYDGDGRRIKKVAGAETTIFVYNVAGMMAAEYTLGVSSNANPQTSYLTTDTLGSLRVATNAAGQVIARHDYLPFGDEILGLGGRTSAQGFGMPDTTRQRFTGYEKDAESGLDFAQARYYGNGLGRFTSIDLLMDSAKPSLPQSWNRYSYCLNNSPNLTDPSGLIWGTWSLHGIRHFQWYKDIDAMHAENGLAWEFTQGWYLDSSSGNYVMLNPDGPDTNADPAKGTWDRDGWMFARPGYKPNTFGFDPRDSFDNSVDMMPNQPFEWAAGGVAGKIGGRFLVAALERNAARWAAGAGTGAIEAVSTGTCEPALGGPLRFTQNTASALFSVSKNSPVSGQRLVSVIEDLRSKTLSPGQLPVHFVEVNGVRLIVNTRSALALTRAGVAESNWTFVNQTANREVMSEIAARLGRNGLSWAGRDSIRITGMGSNISCIH